jgi:fumarylacetoacetase
VTDQTHELSRRSWVESANYHPSFPIQNLPFGVFDPGDGRARVGVAIGDMILDLAAALRSGAFDQDLAALAALVDGDALNPLMAAGSRVRKALRRALSAALAEGAPATTIALLAPVLFNAAECRMLLPSRIGDYTDFFAGIHHAERAGAIFRPDAPLPPNYKYVPIGYHGRASTVVVSPADVRRPNGQVAPINGSAPSVEPSQKLDYEYEIGIWIAGGNSAGEPVPIDQAADQIFGFSLFNDCSARDIQRWEAQPLGPFLAKSFVSVTSPWIVTAEALEPFRHAQPSRPAGDPQPLPYLSAPLDQAEGALAIDLAIHLRSAAMAEKGAPPVHVAAMSALHLYWTPAQLVAHHTINGCRLNPGDLLGSGTISGLTPESCGCLLEQTLDGATPIALPGGETRDYLADGDEVIFTAQCRRDGFVPIGFGENRTLVVSAI